MSFSRKCAALLLAVFLAGCGTVSPHRTGLDQAPEKMFLWPVFGTVSSGFGTRAGGRHDGIDILAPGGTPVGAAAQGIVVYAGDGMRGYGNAVILDHGVGLTTLYGHLDTIRVKSPEVVTAGAIIGTVGRTGNATTTHLHFELRIEGEAVDPIGNLVR